MKKLFVTVIMLVFVFTCAASVTAADEFATAGDLYQYWAATYPPDCVCGVWSTDGGSTNLTIAVQNNKAGNAGKQEILDLVADDSTVTFTYQEYSLNYLRGVQDEIHPYFAKDLGLTYSGVDEYNNRLTLGILEERIDEADTQAMILELYEQYGDIFIIEYSNGFVATLEETVADMPSVILRKNSVDSAHIIIVVCAAGIMLFTAIFVILSKKKNALTLQTNTGESMSAPGSVSLKEVENMVKSSTAEINPDLDAKIMNEIENI